MDVSLIPIADKRLIARKVGADLVKCQGKKEHYTAAEIKISTRRLLFPEIWDCWALSLFCSPGEFADYHRNTGEICDYSSMHQKMLDAVSTDSALPDVLQHVTAATETSWFSDLLDVFDTDHLDIDHVDIDP